MIDTKDEKGVIEHLIKQLKGPDILEAIGDGVSIQDTDFKVLYQNQVHKKLVGQHLGKYCYEAYEHREQVCDGCPVALAFKDGNTHTAERSALTDRGMLYAEITASPLRDSTGKIIAGIEIARDISERKYAQEALRESESKFRNLAEKSLVGIYLIQNGVCKYVNPRLAEIFGYSVEELIDKKGPRDLTLPQDWLTVEGNIKKRVSGEIESLNYNVRGIKKNKDIIYFEVYGTRTMYKGEPAIVGTLMDITGRKRMETEVTERIKELEEFYDMSVNRELRIKELKAEIQRLKSELSRYQK